ncbi:hypothetical protein D9M71_696710 [compost metagenome]
MSTVNEVWQRSRWELLVVVAKLKLNRKLLRSPIFSAGTDRFSLVFADSLDNTARRNSSSRSLVLASSGRLVMN